MSGTSQSFLNLRAAWRCATALRFTVALTQRRLVRKKLSVGTRLLTAGRSDVIGAAREPKLRQKSDTKARPLERGYSAVSSVRGPPHPPKPQDLESLSSCSAVSNAACPRPCRDNWTIFDDPQRSANTLRRRLWGGCEQVPPNRAGQRNEDGRTRPPKGGRSVPFSWRIGVPGAWHSQWADERPSTNLKLPTNPRAVSFGRCFASSVMTRERSSLEPQGGGNPRPSGRGGCQDEIPVDRVLRLSINCVGKNNTPPTTASAIPKPTLRGVSVVVS